MDDRQGRDAGDAPASRDDPDPERNAREGNWEKRALARVRPHLKRISESGAAGTAGWETDTLTRLEGYFEREED